MTDGVTGISSVDDNGDGVHSFTVNLEGDADKIRDTVMSECIGNGISILEIYTDKPNLESVFIELINRPVKKSGLQELLDETPDVSADTTKEKEEK